MECSFRASLLAALTGVGLTLGCLAPAGPAAGQERGEGRYRTPGSIAAQQQREDRLGITFAKLVRGNPRRKEIALTFDDGPHRAFTPRLLDLLRRLRVPATFFVVGKMVDAAPDLVRREAAEGHEVETHTYHHLRLPTLTEPRILQELRLGAAAIERALGRPPELFRPPGGEYDDRVVDVARQLGYTMVLWTDDPGDYAKPGASAELDRLLCNVSNGGIILLHDGVEVTLRILPLLVARLRSQGYRFVLCSDMLEEGGAITTGGPRILPRALTLPPSAGYRQDRGGMMDREEPSCSYRSFAQRRPEPETRERELRSLGTSAKECRGGRRSAPAPAGLRAAA